MRLKEPLNTPLTSPLMESSSFGVTLRVLIVTPPVLVTVAALLLEPITTSSDCPGTLPVPQSVAVVQFPAPEAIQTSVVMTLPP